MSNMSWSFGERYASRHNESFVFQQTQIREKLMALLDSKIEDFEKKFPNFIDSFHLAETSQLLECLKLLSKYDFLDEDFLKDISKKRRPLVKLQKLVEEVGFLMENYSEYRRVYPFLKLLLDAGILAPNRLLSLKIKSALEQVQNNNLNAAAHLLLLKSILSRQSLDENIILCALQTTQPDLMLRLLQIYSNVFTPTMVYQFFELVENWGEKSKDYLDGQLQLLTAMEFFNEKENCRHLMDSGLFDWVDTENLKNQIEFFKFFHPQKRHFAEVLQMQDPSFVTQFLLSKASDFINESDIIDQVLDVFFKLLSIYKGDYDKELLDKTLVAAFKFKDLVKQLNHPALQSISARSWHKFVDIALNHSENFEDKACRFIECLDQGERFMRGEISFFSIRRSPMSVSEGFSPVIPKFTNFESEDHVSSTIGLSK